ncbi:hypothetical protein HDU87_002274 [Geranomyces variabilis]|uniref:DIS3-like exonuclease 2 n=1 Tax=Geranomyces variabilis TaxID=109894 RepID=A0AAD5TLA6_9FUNG|nr:hypothetical protein HDU87_002274 [Geranomyces variabilis]
MKRNQNDFAATTQNGETDSLAPRDAVTLANKGATSLLAENKQGGMLGDLSATASARDLATLGATDRLIGTNAPAAAKPKGKKKPVMQSAGSTKATLSSSAGDVAATTEVDRPVNSTVGSANSRKMKRHKQGSTGLSEHASAESLGQSSEFRIDRQAAHANEKRGKPSGGPHGVSASASAEHLASKDTDGALNSKQNSPRGGKKNRNKQSGAPNGSSAAASTHVPLRETDGTGSTKQRSPRGGNKARGKQSEIIEEAHAVVAAEKVPPSGGGDDLNASSTSPKKKRTKDKAPEQKATISSSGGPQTHSSANAVTRTVIAAAVALPIEFQSSDETYDFADLNKNWRAQSSAARGGRKAAQGSREPAAVQDVTSPSTIRRAVSNQSFSAKKEPIVQRPVTAGGASGGHVSAVGHKQGGVAPGGTSQMQMSGHSVHTQARQNLGDKFEHGELGGHRHDLQQDLPASTRAHQTHDRYVQHGVRHGDGSAVPFAPKGSSRPHRSGPLDDPWKDLQSSTTNVSRRDMWKDPPRTTQFDHQQWVQHTTPARGVKTWEGAWNKKPNGSEQNGMRPASGGRRLWVDDNRGRSSPRDYARAFYEEHLSQDAVQKGLQAGTLHQGSLRINKRNRSDAYVTLVNQTTDNDIYLCGVKARNRALEGDIVVLRILEGEELQREMSFENGRQQKKQAANDERQAKCDVIEHDVDLDSESCVEETGPEDQPAKDEKRIYGKVVHILERRADENFAGTLGFDMPYGPSRDHATTGGRDRAPKILWFKPTDKRAPLIAIPVENVPREFLQDPAAFSQILFKAKVRKWSANSQYPIGVVTGTLGQMGEISVESAALLVDAGVVWDDFSDDVLACLPALPWQIPAEEYQKRRDFRDERIFSIDPPTARDLDDAVSVKALGDGVYEIGVHIADVAFFVKPDSALDKEARYRATTVYLVQRAIPMLPRLLCEELCSLNPGVERLAFSVTWRMDSSARVIGEPWFGRSIIKSCAKLSYDHAQRLIDGKDWEGLPKVELTGNSTIHDIKADTLRLYEFSRMMRKRRFEEGALSMQNIKLSFGIDEYGNPISVGVYQIKDSNKLIEEFMLLANMTVAQKIAARFPDAAMLRNHAAPKARGMTEFVDFAAQLGYVINAENSSTLQKSFEAITDPEKRIVMRQLCIKPMQRAKYFSTGSLDIKGWHHFALNVPLYTHFTSPIRRYCDLMVHRMLEMVCDGTPGQLYEDKEVASVSKHCNGRKEASKEAQEASQKLYLCAYLTKLGERKAEPNAKPGVLTEGIVHKVGPRSYDVLIQEFGIEKRIWIEDAVDSGEAVGVDAIPGKIPGLRILWTKRGASDADNLADGVQQMKLQDAAAVEPSNNGQPTAGGSKPNANNWPTKPRPNSGQKRRFDPSAVVEQTVRVFDVVIVRVIPEITRSPPEFRILAEHPDDCRDYAAAAQHARELLRGNVTTDVRESCPAAAEDAE